MAGAGPDAQAAAAAAGIPAAYGAAGGGGGGLGGILQWLAAGGISNQAYQNMGVGATGNRVGGTMYGVPGAGGALRGLSSAGVEWLQKTLMQKNSPVMQSLFAPDVTGADGTVTKGAALTGSDKLMAMLHNSLAGLTPATYGVADAYKDMTAQQLMDSIAGMGAGSPDLYGRGYDGSGWMQLTGGPGGYDRFHNQHVGNNEDFAHWRYDQYTQAHHGADQAYNAWLKAHKGVAKRNKAASAP